MRKINNNNVIINKNNNKSIIIQNMKNDTIIELIQKKLDKINNIKVWVIQI